MNGIFGKLNCDILFIKTFFISISSCSGCCWYKPQHEFVRQLNGVNFKLGGSIWSEPLQAWLTFGHATEFLELSCTLFGRAVCAHLPANNSSDWFQTWLKHSLWVWLTFANTPFILPQLVPEMVIVSCVCPFVCLTAHLSILKKHYYSNSLRISGIDISLIFGRVIPCGRSLFEMAMLSLFFVFHRSFPWNFPWQAWSRSEGWGYHSDSLRMSDIGLKFGWGSTTEQITR